MIKNYEVQDMSIWNGRIDSKEDFDAFRFHQWVEKINLNDKNLKPFKGKMGFAILGFKSDIGIAKNLGRQGAFKAPTAIRKELANKPCNFSKEVKIFDAGNISSNKTTLEDAQNSLSIAVQKLLELNYFPILLGGGHEIVFGHYKGLFEHFRNTNDKPNIGIVNFDAHFDNRPYEEGNGSSGTMFRQIYDLNKSVGDDYNYFVMGIQNHANTVSLFKFADKSNTKYVMAKEISNGDIYLIFEKIDTFLRNIDHLYITLDCDVFSSSIAPGVSAPQPLGLDPELVMILLKYVLNSEKTVSFDVAEVSPRFDHDNTTASLAAVFIFTLITKISTWI